MFSDEIKLFKLTDLVEKTIKINRMMNFNGAFLITALDINKGIIYVLEVEEE
jgi:hypothetical protein